MRKRKVNGEKLRDLREDLWLSQGELAERSGVALHTINRIENGRTPYPQSATLLSIAEALEVDPHELLEGESKPPLDVSPNGESEELETDLKRAAKNTSTNYAGFTGPLLSNP